MKKNYGFNGLLAVLLLSIVLAGCKKEVVWQPGMPMPREKIKVAVIHPNEIDSNSLYDYAHYMGTLEMQKDIGLADYQILRKFNVYDANPAQAEWAIRDCIAEGANVIITTSRGYIDVCEKLAREFQQVIFVNTTCYKYNNSNLTSYSAKVYQARYLSGIVAGMRTKTGHIGYVAAKGSNNSEVTRGINAFAMGVEAVNPAARVHVRIIYNWYDPMGEADAANALIAFGCDVITAHSNTSAPQIAAQKAGVWSIGFNSDMSADAPEAVITSVVPHWGIFYTKLVESIINGTFKAKPFLYGLSEGAVDITPLNEKLAAKGTVAAVEAARQSIIREGFNIFDGVLKTNDGRTVGEPGKTLSDESIFNSINWYYRNVAEL